MRGLDVETSKTKYTTRCYIAQIRVYTVSNWSKPSVIGVSKTGGCRCVSGVIFHGLQAAPTLFAIFHGSTHTIALTGAIFGSKVDSNK